MLSGEKRVVKTFCLNLTLCPVHLFKSLAWFNHSEITLALADTLIACCTE